MPHDPQPECAVHLRLLPELRQRPRDLDKNVYGEGEPQERYENLHPLKSYEGRCHRCLPGGCVHAPRSSQGAIGVANSASVKGPERKSWHPTRHAREVVLLAPVSDQDLALRSTWQSFTFTEKDIQVVTTTMHYNTCRFFADGIHN